MKENVIYYINSYGQRGTFVTKGVGALRSRGVAVVWPEVLWALERVYTKAAPPRFISIENVCLELLAQPRTVSQVFVGLIRKGLLSPPLRRPSFAYNLFYGKSATVKHIVYEIKRAVSKEDYDRTNHSRSSGVSEL